MKKELTRGQKAARTRKKNRAARKALATRRANRAVRVAVLQDSGEDINAILISELEKHPVVRAYLALTRMQ